MKPIRLCAALCLTAMAMHAIRPPQARAEWSPDQLINSINGGESQIDSLMPDARELENPDQRAALAPKLIPLLNQHVADISKLLAAQPAEKDDYTLGLAASLEELVVLGDKNAANTLAQMAQSTDPITSQTAFREQLVARWVYAIQDAAAQSKIIDDLEKMDIAHPESETLTAATWGFAGTAATPQLKDRLFKMVSAMNNPQVAIALQAEARKKAIEDASENKPLVLSGETIDGNDFTTATWKGKVILVDFWATWCGPCVGEMPRVKKMYDEYHAQGLEVLGVSNDMSGPALKDFIVKNDMPWPELWDSAAADKQKWNPVTTDRAIHGIPVTFLIDKKGVCRTVSARQNMEAMIPQLLAE